LIVVEDSFAASKAALSLHSHQDENPPSPTSLEPLNLADQQTIKAQQTIIADLKSELEQQTEQHLLNSHEASLQLETLVSQVNSMKQLNQSLMEENESYQVLLHEKTLCGDFMSDPIVQVQKSGNHDDHSPPVFVLYTLVGRRYGSLLWVKEETFEQQVGVQFS
jgi:hypothetical protein